MTSASRAAPRSLCTILTLGALLLHPLANRAESQTYYRNLDAGQPSRIEDAEVTALYSLSFALSPLTFERLIGGSSRYRAEPKLSYGILPLTEVEVRVPLVELVPPASSGAASTSGVAGVAIGLTHAFTIETASTPALALAGEVSLPVGALAGAQGSFLLKGLATKTIGATRFHLNAGGGTYSVGSPKQSSDCQTSGVRLIIAGDTTCSSGPIIIFDAPCRVSPPPRGRASVLFRCMTPPTDSAATTPAPAPPANGAHWFAGLGADHSFGLRSTLISADLVAEHFIKLYDSVDWTAEVGLRHQLTPIIVVDLGAGRHFAGAIPSTFIIAGASFEFATPPWTSR